MPATTMRRSDAAIAASVINSTAGVHIGGTAAITAGAAANITATNTNTIVTTADGSVVHPTPAVPWRPQSLTVTRACWSMAPASIISTGNLLLKSTSNRNLTTNSIATPRGASDDGNAGTQTQGQQALANNDASTSDGAMKLGCCHQRFDVDR